MDADEHGYQDGVFIRVHLRSSVVLLSLTVQHNSLPFKLRMLKIDQQTNL